MNGIDINEFRRQAEAAKASHVPQGEPVEIWGIRFIGRRLSMMTYIINGRVPTYLTDLIMNTRPKNGVDDDLEPEEDSEAEAAEKSQLEIQGLAAMGAFARTVVQDAVISPVIVFEETRPLKEGEIYASELPDGWLDAVYEWALHHSPGIGFLGVSGKGAGPGGLEMFPENGKGAEGIS